MIFVEEKGRYLDRNAAFAEANARNAQAGADCCTAKWVVERRVKEFVVTRYVRKDEAPMVKRISRIPPKD